MNRALLFFWHLATCLSASRAADVDPTDATSAAAYTLTPPDAPPEYNVAVDNGTYGYYPVRTYATAAELHSPQTNFLTWDERCDDGLFYFLTPRGWGIPDPGPMILDGHGELVWAKHFDNKFGGQAYDFMVQRYQGEDYLTFWLGDDRVRGHGSGFYYMLNASYDVVHRVGAAGGLSADLHEFLITDEGTALMTMYQVFPHNVTDFRHFNASDPEDQNPNYIWDCVFQEVDIATSDLVFEWRASEHIDLHDTYHDIGAGGTQRDPFDWYHINSVEKDALGNFLVSARYTHGIYYVDGITGELLWTLGGKRNAFMDLSDGFGINFAWQHDARLLPLDTFPNMYRPPPEREGYTTSLLSLFDNAAEDQHYEYGMTYSRGLLLEITYPSDALAPTAKSGLDRRQDYSEPDLNHAKVAAINGTDPAYTVRVINSYENPKLVRSSSQGSMQILPPPNNGGRDPKVLVGFGLNAVWTEYEADGTVLCDVHYGADTSWERGDIQSYRVYKLPWTGMPEDPPSVEISDDDVEVYVSWNGATAVADWVLQCAETESGDEKAWADVLRVRRSGFETVLALPDDATEPRFLRVLALDSAGRRLAAGVSATIDRGLMSTYYPLASATEAAAARMAMTPVQYLLVALSSVSGVLVLYEGYRRYLGWTTGRAGGGALRWRKGKAYRLLGES
ncbi:hypothetical protein LTR53_001994 [Teratosphaeriaceae sp. CCFEE 6253]|nr:hypothetical protein LTR53_001994 [Teratosphaeriaceae sp. CCFEE 6253]